MAEMLKLLSRLAVLGFLLFLIVALPLTMPAKTQAASSPSTQIQSTSITSDNNTMYAASRDNGLALSPDVLSWFYRFYGTGNGIGSFPDGNLYPFNSPESTFIVASPSGGETWTAGSQQAIKWTYTGNPGTYVKIELLKDGAFYQTITQKAPTGTGGSGLYNWTIPSSEISGNNFQIRVTSTTDSAFTGSSKNTFSILKAPITVSSPKDGESYTAGQWQEIDWACSGNPGPYVKIELLKGGAYYQTITTQTPAGSDGSGRCYVWTIPSTQIPGDKYQIKITSTSNTTCTATSEGNFRIKGPPIIVTSPSGEGWARESQYAITWMYNSNPGPYVKIDLYKDGVFQRPIASMISIGSGGTGFYLWTISPYQMLGDNYQIRVTSTTDPSCTGLSANSFYITEALDTD
ncbi:MAG: Ser-Thr-rich GPI-anchored membrane family protein [Dehalococcoidales bacterium]